MKTESCCFCLCAILCIASHLPADEPIVGREQLDSVVWMQTSVEYEMVCDQVYVSARAQLAARLQERDITAALEQTGNFCDLPPAVIMDVDETVLDNGPFQARMVRGGVEYSPEAWAKWCHEASAKCLPGAKEFINHANLLGVRVFFVTNRDVTLRDSTWTNLKVALEDPSLPLSRVLCKNQQPGWSSDKTSRRQFVARTHRVLMLVGDDYNDFAYLGTASPAKRKRLAAAHRSQWGRRWFLLPNPVYGSWEKAALKYEFKRHAKQIQQKYDLLNTGR